MTLDIIKAYYEHAKQIYKNNIPLKIATARFVELYPEEKESSAQHYLLWYSKMRKGEFLTWNSNSQLLYYYSSRIVEEEGLEEGKKAIQAAIAFAKHVSRNTLEKDLISLAKKSGIELDEMPIDNVLTAAAWWPSKEEYPLNLTKEDWKSFILEIEKPEHPTTIGMLKAMLEMGGQATCKQLALNYGGTANVYIASAMMIGKRAKVYFEVDPFVYDGKESFFTLPFEGKRVEENIGEGTYIYRLRPELKAALEEIDLTDVDPNYPIDHKIGSFDSWDVIDEVTAVKHCDKSFFEHKGSGVPKEICWFFGAESLSQGETRQITFIYNGKAYNARVSNESSDRRRVRIFWYSDLSKLFNNYYSMDTLAEFKRISEDLYTITIKAGEAQMTTKDKVSAIKAYIASQGFTYESDLIENFYLSLKSKPFVILAGTSGTGKTRLVKLFAKAIGAKLKVVPVRPDWSDSSDLFGHNDLSGQFHPGAIIDFIKEAEKDLSKPYFLCLDEMNLARVEYYLSDFLSIIETREVNDSGVIVTDPLIDETYYQKDTAKTQYGKIYIPENLYIVGTVNMDETTFPFSKKVLDRANTIEFSLVNLMAKVKSNGQATEQQLDNSFLKSDYLYLRDCDDDELINDVCSELESLNQMLVKANLHVGYRVRDEICFYMMNNKNADLLKFDIAFDHEIMQKILPRIQGSSSAIKDVLAEMFVKCAGDYSGFTGSTEYEQMNAYIESKSCKYPNSAKKIAFMMRRYIEDGFTSYWL